MSGRRWNSITHRTRPPASSRGARIAWDMFIKHESLKENPRKIKSMWYAFMDYWVWVAEFDDGDFDEIDGLMVADRLNNPEKYEKNESLSLK